MPPGAKKRKALKKKKQQQRQQESTVTSKGFNGDNLHGHDEHVSQDDSNLSSPVSQGNEGLGTKDPSGFVKDTAKEISDHVTQGLAPISVNGIAFEGGTDGMKNIVEKSPRSSYENSTQTAKNLACQDPCVKEIASVDNSVKPVVFVSNVVISEKSEHAEPSNLVNKKSHEKKEFPSTGVEKVNGKVASLPVSAAGASRKVESVRESEVPVFSEEKRLLLPGPLAVRTSWLSCCGLFDAATGSDR